MHSKEIKMNRLSAKLGYWSALVCLITFIVFTVCFVAIAIVNPLFTWTNLSDFVTYTQNNNQLFKYIAQFSMLIFGAAYVVMLAGIYDYTPEDKKILTRISIYFGILFAALVGINYFVQISAVRLDLLKGQLTGLEQFVQSNPTSGIAAINMLGWSLFLGLSSIFIAPVFAGGKLEKVIKYAFLVNGIICLLGGVGYVFDIVALVFFCMNFGMGGALMVAMIALCMLFRKLDKASTPSTPPQTKSV